MKFFSRRQSFRNHDKVLELEKEEAAAAMETVEHLRKCLRLRLRRVRRQVQMLGLIATREEKIY